MSLPQLRGEVATMLQAARVIDVAAEHLPVLPEWWPADPKPSEDNPHPQPLSPAARAAGREQLALREARRGPYDGTRGLVYVDGEPPAVLRFGDASGFGYRLMEDESDPRALVYRYSPADSPAHAEAMRAVEAAYREVGGPDYTQAARTDAPVSHGVTMERTA